MGLAFLLKQQEGSRNFWKLLSPRQPGISTLRHSFFRTTEPGPYFGSHPLDGAFFGDQVKGPTWYAKKKSPFFCGNMRC